MLSSSPLSTKTGLAPDRRTQRRISAEIPVAVVVRGAKTSLKGVTKDISWGGALISLAQPLPPDALVVRVMLPWKRDASINAIAQIQRAKRLHDGRTLVAIRFLSLSPRSNLRLENLLETLSDSVPRSVQSDEAGLVRELEMDVSDAEELRDMMETIATGRYSCTVFQAYAEAQSLCFVLAGTEEWQGIRLRARVAEVRPTTLPGYTDIHLYSVTLQFEHPRESLAKLIEHILGQLPESGDTTMLADWTQTVAQAEPPRLTSAPDEHEPVFRCPIIAPRHSALEMEFPEALNYLMLGWGDAEAFEMMFRELTIGERFQLGGWPPDAWEELTLLQDVHDSAYGLTSERDKFRRFGT